MARTIKGEDRRAVRQARKEDAWTRKARRYQRPQNYRDTSPLTASSAA